ncbi:Phage protein D-like protein [Xylanimonas cellulosilytica DSM 15894]|uniref:Phage protein D-like protein n=1 Tax=Xylanimonas cellulosilytica (strain DSM 15894 / JCM 12276 / CECT 5975 / KCTC 9989 / LMG 20990 / NBRC 107835 / XIL07) TaxID=446471 RepID=D1BTJ4_XYLCX|nr:contractile injection system protein, VgrG/Pvc8 family [Xylanimonas cellulosilytica]ACZ30973.1 Phage protein D-like protein [Xylanimonas cellulosilytica DSM 15894]
MSTDTFTPLAQQSTEYGGFYVPRMEILIDGQGLPRDIAKDIVSLTYVDSIETIDSFTLVVNNWDDERHEFRYIGSETADELTPGHRNHALRTLFESCGKEVEVRLGYGNDLVTMVRGTFTTMQPEFTDGGAVLKVTGQNVLHQLRGKQYSDTWHGKRDTEVIADLAQRSDNGRKRFPLPVYIDPDATQNEKPVPVITQNRQTDLDFMWQRARARGFVIFVQEADKDQKIERRLYFGPARPGFIPGFRTVRYRLTWGRSLMVFKPVISTASQVRSVTVKGWNRTAKEPISRTVRLDDPRIDVNTDLFRMLRCNEREEIVTDEPIFENCHARERAIAILVEQVKRLITAEGVKVVGLPQLRAGQVVQIDGVGARLSGEYFITKTTHTFDDNGYVTTFDCRREQPQDTKG